ncbi:MAG TPA: diiron oxygenase [Caldimonas sp.]|nr:diiron oxygenase [Caldimonas sp.]
MQTDTASKTSQRYARVIDASKRVHWEIDRDLVRQRTFDMGRKFLPDGLSLANELPFLSSADARLYSQVQGRTYANLFGLVERFISAKMCEVGREHALGDQLAFEALVRFTDEELKHQSLFRRIESMMKAQMGGPYACVAQPDDVARVVLGKSTWAVLALTTHIELFVLAHYRSSIDTEAEIDPLWKDVFRFHWRDEAQHAVIDDLEWRRTDASIGDAERDAAVDELLALVGALDSILQQQAAADVACFVAMAGARFDDEQRRRIDATMLKAYRWQYIVSGVMEPRFQKTLFELVTPAQRARIEAAMAPLADAVPSQPTTALPMAA